MDLHHETEVQIAHPACTNLYSLSGCSGPNRVPSCLYLAVALTRGPLIGNYVDPSGPTWDLKAASLDVGRAVGRALDGSFIATFVDRSTGGLLSASGTFHAPRRACLPSLTGLTFAPETPSSVEWSFEGAAGLFFS